MLSIKKGAQVKIISGKDKGKTGEILEIKRSANKVKIKAIKIIPHIIFKNGTKLLC